MLFINKRERNITFVQKIILYIKIVIIQIYKDIETNGITFILKLILDGIITFLALYASTVRILHLWATITVLICLIIYIIISIYNHSIYKVNVGVQYLYCNNNNSELLALYCPTFKSVLIKKGSYSAQISRKPTKSLHKKYIKKLRKLKNGGYIKDNIFIKDCLFGSRTEALKTIFQAPANNEDNWKIKRSKKDVIDIKEKLYANIIERRHKN